GFRRHHVEPRDAESFRDPQQQFDMPRRIAERAIFFLDPVFPEEFLVFGAQTGEPRPRPAMCAAMEMSEGAEELFAPLADLLARRLALEDALREWAVCQPQSLPLLRLAQLSHEAVRFVERRHRFDEFRHDPILHSL